MIGATIAFAIARRWGRAGAERFAGRHAAALERWLDRHGFVTLLYARLLPVTPFSALNYAAGLSPVPTRDYVLATTIGIVPGTVAYAVLGSAAGHPGSMLFLVALGAVGALTLLEAISRPVHRGGIGVGAK